MEKRLIIIAIIPFLMFFKWFDPVVRENKKGEKAYQNKKYKEALNHFKAARNIISNADNYKSELSNISDKLDGMSSYIKNIKAETLNISDLNENHKKPLLDGLSDLSKGLSEFADLTAVYKDKNNDKENNILSEKIIKNLKDLSLRTGEKFAEKGSGNIGDIFKDIAYTKSQIDLYDSKIGAGNDGGAVTPDLEALRYNVASSLYELGDYKNAKNEFEKINPDKSNIERSDIFFDLGNTHFKMKDYEQALELYKKSLKENPEDIEARQNYELTLEMIKKQKKDKKDNKDKKDKDKKDKKNQKKDQDKDKNKDQNKDKEKKDNKKDQKDKDKKKEEQQKDKENKPEEQKKKKDKQEEQKKDKQKKAEKPEQKHRNMLQFINQNEKKQMKKNLQKNKLLKYGIKKSKKKKKDW